MPNFRNLSHLVGYVLYRGGSLLARAIPLTALFVTGKFLGAAVWLVLRRRRRLAEANIASALGVDRAEAARLARRHFVTLGANVLSMLKIPSMSDEQIWRHVSFQMAPEISQEPAPDGKGWVAVLSHMSNWELLARLSRLFPQYRFGAIYQKLANSRVDAHFNATRARMGVRLFDRKEGFWNSVAFLESGGVVGVLADQYAGVSGTWMPFFGRLTSTSTMAAALARRVGAKIVPVCVTTTGLAQWHVAVENPLPAGDSVEFATGAINRELERQIRAAPSDWLWVHDRWKTPAFGFLLSASGRRVFFPPSFDRSQLLPWRVLIRSVDDPDEAKVAVPLVQAIKRGRPDAHVTVLSPEALADFWRAVAGVDEVVAWGRDDSLLGIAAKLSRLPRFHAGILLPDTPRAAWELALAGVPRRLGAPGRFLLNHWGNSPGLPDPPPQGEERYRRIATAAGALF
jgi:heptosyltransferase-2